MIRYIVGGFAFLLAVVSISADEKKDATELQGTWVFVSVKEKGKDEPLPDKSTPEFIFTKDRLQVFFDGKKVKDHQIKVDATKTPKQIDILGERDDPRDDLGIYKIEGDTLTIASARGENARPKDFSGKSDKETLVVAVRKKDKK